MPDAAGYTYYGYTYYGYVPTTAILTMAQVRLMRQAVVALLENAVGADAYKPHAVLQSHAGLSLGGGAGRR